jgi:cytochrome b561
MNNTYKLIPKIVLWLLILAGIGVVGLFFFGGDLAEGHEVAGDILPIPTYSDVLLYLTYALVALVILVTFGFVLVKYGASFKTDVKGALKTLGVVVAAVVLCWLCWHMGSDAKVDIIGYEGTENVGFMARLTDAIMYLTYILTGATVVALVFGAVYSKIKK